MGCLAVMKVIYVNHHHKLHITLEYRSLSYDYLQRNFCFDICKWIRDKRKIDYLSLNLLKRFRTEKKKNPSII